MVLINLLPEQLITSVPFIMSEKEKKANAGSSQKQESLQSKVTTGLKKENEALEDVTKKQDDTISSLSKNIKELRTKEYK